MDNQDHWIACHDFIETCRCLEFRRTGSCGCRSKRGKYKGTNPCLRNQRLCDDIISMSYGERARHGNGLEQVAEYIERYTCRAYRSGGCNHEKCNKATALLRWLRDMMRVRKAA